MEEPEGLGYATVRHGDTNHITRVRAASRFTRMFGVDDNHCICATVRPRSRRYHVFGVVIARTREPIGRKRSDRRPRSKQRERETGQRDGVAFDRWYSVVY